MEQNHIEFFRGKKVLIVLKNNFAYECVIKSTGKESTLILDKWGKSVSIDNDSIERIEERRSDK